MKRSIWFSIAAASLAWAPFDLEGQPPYSIGNGVSPPTVLHKVKPEYSEEARRAGLEGTVILSLVVDEEGNPRDIRPIRTLGKGLDEKAIEAVKQWKFRPGMKDGQAVAVQCTFEVNFRGASAEISRKGISHRDESGAGDAHPMNVGDSSGGNLSTALKQESLLGGKDLPAGSGTLSAPGYGKHSYVIAKLDLGEFAYGGTLVIEISVGHKKAEASFDLFPDGTSLDFTGYGPEHGSVAHVWSVPRDSTVHLVHRFDRGGVFVLGAEGSWYAKKGSSNDFRYSARVYENMDSLIKHGAALNASDAADLEERTRREPGDVVSRTMLVAYYSMEPGKGPKSVRFARSAHILWMIKNCSTSSVFDTVGLWALNRVGDPLADEEAYDQGKASWLDQVKLHADDSLTVKHAVQYLEIDSPEEAERLALGLIGKDRRFLSLLGEIYGFSVLGVTARDYATGKAKMASADRAQSDFAKRALATLDASPEPVLTRSAAKVIAEQGSKLRESGNLSWDYESISKRLLDKSSGQPQRIRVGGNVQAANLVEKVTPQYPPDAKAARIQGTVRFTVIIGLDGHIQSMELVSGDPSLVAAASEAVRQWVYKPTLLNGKPVEVVTQIDTNFTLSN